MNARIVARTTDSYLRLLRLPLQTVVGFLPGEDGGARPAAQLRLDRADAGLRQILGTVIGDQALVDDAIARHAAADQRERAARLRETAHQRSAQADAKLDKRQEQAEHQRQAAEQQAEEKKQAAERTRAAKLEQAAKAESARKSASRKSKAAAEESVARREPKEKLDALEARSAALGEKDKALTAADEARRLRDAASREKAKRNNA